MSEDASGIGGLSRVGGDSDARIAEVRGWTGKALGATPKLLLVYESKLVIARGSRLEAARTSGQAEGAIAGLVVDVGLQVLRAFGRRRNRREIADTDAFSPSEYGAAHPNSVVLANDSITSVRLTQERTKTAGKHFVVSVGQGTDHETSFSISSQGNPGLKTDSQLSAMFASVFGDRFTNDVVETLRPPRNRRTDRALAVVAGLAFAIAVADLFLPWVSIRYEPIGVDLGQSPWTVTDNGLDFGWKAAVLLGVAIATFALWRIAGPRLVWTLRVSTGATIFLAAALLYFLRDMPDKARSASDSTLHVSSSPAAGLFLVILAAAIVVAAEFLLLNQTAVTRLVLPALAVMVVIVGGAAITVAVSGSGSPAASVGANDHLSRTHQLVGSPTTGETLTTTVPPILGPVGESDAAAGNQALFNDNRTQVEAALRAQPDPKLTGFSFDSQTNMISAVFAYQHPAQENRARYDSFAWHVGQALSDSFWFPQLVQSLQSQHVDVAFLPKLRVRLDSVSYQCPAVVEIAVDAHRLSQHDWLQKCAS